MYSKVHPVTYQDGPEEE